jgi:aspartyl-tRNA(Asn)/glutamyl-tRNA(Gln) amidotransferase subunit C
MKTTTVSSNEERSSRHRFSVILDPIELLQEMDVEGGIPAAHVIDLSSIMRPDEVLPSLPRADILKHVPSYQGGMFRSKAVFEE